MRVLQFIGSGPLRYDPCDTKESSDEFLGTEEFLHPCGKQRQFEGRCNAEDAVDESNDG